MIECLIEMYTTYHVSSNASENATLHVVHVPTVEAGLGKH